MNSAQNLLRLFFQIKPNRRELFSFVHHNCADKKDIENKRYYFKKMWKEDEGKHFIFADKTLLKTMILSES